MEKCQSGSYDNVESYMNDFAAEGFSASQLLTQLHERVIFASDLTDKQKSAIAEKMAVKIQQTLVKYNNGLKLMTE